jgi:hypothetical protein
MPEEVVFRDRAELLTFEEIARFVAVAASLGVGKVRLTGGEPLVRKELHRLVRLLVAVPGLTDLALTTNGILLAEQAADLHTAGLRRLNVSLDTLDPVKFREVSRREGLDRVLAGLEEATRVGFTKIKVNAVALRGLTETEAVPLAASAATAGTNCGSSRRCRSGPTVGPLARLARRRAVGVARPRGVAAAAGRRRRPERPGGRVRVRRRRREGGRDRVDLAAVLRGVQPAPPDRRREGTELPLRAGRGRRPPAAPPPVPGRGLLWRNCYGGWSGRSGRATRSTRPGS